MVHITVTSGGRRSFQTCGGLNPLVGARSRPRVKYIRWSAPLREAWSSPTRYESYDACQAMASMSTPSWGLFRAPDSAVCYSSSTTDHIVTYNCTKRHEIGLPKCPRKGLGSYDSCRFLQISGKFRTICETFAVSIASFATWFSVVGTGQTPTPTKP